MADVNLEYVVYFVGVLVMFSFLVGLMPAGFLYAGYELEAYDQQTYPQYLTAHEIANLAYWDNDTVIYNTPATYFDLNETQWKISFSWYSSPTRTNRSFHIWFIVWKWWVFEWVELCEVQGYNATNQWSAYLTFYEDAENNWWESRNSSKFRAWSPSSPTIDVWCYDENETRNDLYEAWYVDGELGFTLGMGIDAFSSTMSSWGVIAKFLSFQAIGDMPTYISYPMNVFLWVGIGYCIYCLILKVIPFVS